MSELDDFFGPQEKVEMPPATQSHFGRHPSIQSLCDTFLSEMEWNTDPYTIQQIAAGARDYALAIGHDTALLLRVIKKMKREKMSIGSPRSCITFARELMHSPDSDSEEGRQKYVTGKYADFWEVDDE